MKYIEVKEYLSGLLKEKGSETFAKVISDAINETGISRNQSFTVHKKVADKLIAISKKQIMEEN